MKLKELEKRLKQEPDNLGLRVQVAGLLRELGRSVEAVELYRSVALVYRDQGRVQQAIAVCRSILEIAPEDAACTGLLAMLQGQTLAPTTVKSPMIPPAAAPIPSLAHPPEATHRSSQDETPLPQPVPYHVADPTSQPYKISDIDIEVELSTSRGVPGDMDLAAELDTRPRPRIASEQIRKLDNLPATSPVELVEVDDQTAPRARDSADDLATQRFHTVTPSSRGSEDAITPARATPTAIPRETTDDEQTKPRDLPVRDADD